jgi:hypothetical protein
MLNLKKIWDRWLSAGDIQEVPSRDGDYETRREPPIPAISDEASGGLTPEALLSEPDLAASILCTPRLLTV